MEIIDVVDENNKVIGKEDRKVAHSKGLIHRATNILVFNSKGDIFLQKRSGKKLICPLKMDLSTAEHLRTGETFQEAALRGLKEELGIQGVKLVEKRKPVISRGEYMEGKIKDFEISNLYKEVYDGEIKIDGDEVASGSFYAIKEVKKMVKRRSGDFTPWFLEVWKFLEKNKLV